jgi:uncharacterized protein
MNIKTFIIECGLAVCLLAQPVAAGQLEEAKAAYIRGDDATGMKLLRPLAEQGNSDSQRLLGMVYCLGFGVPIDNAEGAKWYFKAANQGNTLAQYELGGMYEAGRGVPQDYVQAHMWWNLTAAGSLASDVKTRISALDNRDTTAAKMTPDQIAEAQRLAREWTAAHPKK